MMQVNHRESALPVGDVQKIKMKRIKRGECPDCGTTLYKTTMGMLGRVKKSIPINEAGKCYAGRCLICAPLQPNETIPSIAPLTGSSAINNDDFFTDIQQMQSTLGSPITPLDSVAQNGIVPGGGRRLSPIPPPIQPHPGIPTTAAEAAAAVPAAAAAAEPKKAPIPRIILIYQNHKSQIQNGDNDENSSANNSRIDLGLLGLDLEDEVSDVTLDRRIRETEAGITSTATKNHDMIGGDQTTHHTSSNHDHTDYEDTTSREEDNVGKSQSIRVPIQITSPNKAGIKGTASNNIAQESYRNKMKQLFSPSQQEQQLPLASSLLVGAGTTTVIDHNEPLHIRMARLLEVDMNSSLSRRQLNIPDEELDSKVYTDTSVHGGGNSILKSNYATNTRKTSGNIDNELSSCRFVHHQQQPSLIDRQNISRRTLESAGDSLEGMEDNNDNNKNCNIIRRTSMNHESTKYQHHGINSNEIEFGFDQANFYETKTWRPPSQQQQDRQQLPPTAHVSPMTNTRRLQYYTDSGAHHHAQQQQQQQSSHTSTKRIFQPKNVFVSQPFFDKTDLQHSSSNHIDSHTYHHTGPTNQISDLYVDNPDNIFLEQQKSEYVQKQSQSEIYLDRPEIFMEQLDVPKNCNGKIHINVDSQRDSHSQKSGSRRPPNMIAVVQQSEEKSFGGGKGDDGKSRKSSQSNRKPEIVFDLSALGEGRRTLRERGESSYITEDSQQGYAATENSSSHNEYSAYSSRLLMMLDGADHDNDYSTLPSQRIPRIKADNDDLTNFLSHKSSEPAKSTTNHVTGNVFAETGIPKVVFSAVGGMDGTIDGKENKSINEPRTLSPMTSRMASHKILNSTSVKTFTSISKREPPKDLVLSNASSTTNKTYREEIDYLLLQLNRIPVKDSKPVLLRLKELIRTDEVETMEVRIYFMEKNGPKVLATTMWASMTFPRVEEEAFELFLTLITGDPLKELFTDQWNEDLSGLIDALLIAMQTLVADENIQKVGCRIFCSLASHRGNENDGTRSGACLTVLNAMNTHGNSEIVQEWGVRAIYNQCTCSQYSEANKNILVTSKLDNCGSTGFELLERIVRRRVFHLRSGGVMEWVYRLFWCLTASNKSLSDHLTFRMDSIREILLMLEECRSISDASPQLQEAVVGLIANLARVDYYKSFLGTADVVLLMQDTMRGNNNFLEIQIEGCNAIANISVLLTGGDKEELIDSGIIRTIAGALYAFPEQNNEIQESALRAILGLSNESEKAKAAICESKTFSVILQACRLDERSTAQQQELLCKLLASLYSSDRLLVKAMECDSIGALSSALSTFRKSETIAEAGCSAYRNLSRNETTFDSLLRCNVINFVVYAIGSFLDSKSIQINGCWVLWNLCAGTEIGPLKISETDVMKHLVKAIQTHLDSYEVIDVACGALWSLIHRSNALRQDFFNIVTGIESIICTLVMHLDKVPLLEKACGILAYSSNNLRAVPDEVVSSGVCNVVEVMISNPRSTIILQHGAHFLRSAISTRHQHADESAKTISVLMKMLKDSDVQVPFLGEILYFLWVVSEISSDAKSKIVALEGIPLTVSVLDQFRGSQIPFVEDPALGLFKELRNESSSQRGKPT